MERFLANEQKTLGGSDRKCSRSWTSFLTSAEPRPTSLPLQSETTSGSDQPISVARNQLPASFTLHRSCSTPSPSASSSPFSLASPASLGATTPDDDGSNPVDILCLFIDSGAAGTQPHGPTADVVLSSSSSTTSWDSTRSDPDTPVPTLPRAAAEVGRGVRRPSELRLSPCSLCEPATTHEPPASTAAADLDVDASRNCLRRIARRRLRPGLPPFVGAAGRSHWPTHHPPPGHPTPPHRTPRLPPLPSPAEMAYLRSLSGRAFDQESARRASTTDPRAVQRPPCATTSPTPTPDSSCAPSGAADHPATDSTASVGTGDSCKKQLRLYSCSVVDCGKLYSKSSHLKAHMRSHTGTILTSSLYCTSVSF